MEFSFVTDSVRLKYSWRLGLAECDYDIYSQLLAHNDESTMALECLAFVNINIFNREIFFRKILLAHCLED
jgi:hypothetical protein